MRKIDLCIKQYTVTQQNQRMYRIGGSRPSAQVPGPSMITAEVMFAAENADSIKELMEGRGTLWHSQLPVMVIDQNLIEHTIRSYENPTTAIEGMIQATCLKCVHDTRVVLSEDAIGWMKYHRITLSRVTTDLLKQTSIERYYFDALDSITGRE